MFEKVQSESLCFKEYRHECFPEDFVNFFGAAICANALLSLFQAIKNNIANSEFVTDPDSIICGQKVKFNFADCFELFRWIIM